MDKLYYTIGEVAEILGENTSLVRFWSNTFTKQLKPRRNAKGNRMYVQEEIDFLKRIHYLVKTQGMTLEGAAKKISLERKGVDVRVEALESLKQIREQLDEIKKSL